MRLIDRSIISRYLLNFVLLFMLLYLFAVAIDLLLNLDRFVGSARESVGESASVIAMLSRLAVLVFDFQAPRLSQFYGYLHGIVAVGAMGFTLTQMHRHRELVAILSAGVSLYRVALPFFGATFMLSALQLVNQEFISPKVAPLVLRDHGQIGEHSFNEFALPLTRDGSGNLLQAAAFVPGPGAPALVDPTVLVRDARQRTVRRITAERAVWNDEAGAWVFENGEAITHDWDDEGSAGSAGVQPIDRYATDLSPHAITIRRHGQFAALLSLKQINEMLASTDVVDVAALVRFRYARFAYVLLNLLVIGLCLPFFLLREPVPLMKQSVWCAVVAIPSMLGGAIGMTMNLPGISPAVGVFLPVIVLMLLVTARWTYFKT